MKTIFTLIFSILISTTYSQDIDVMIEDGSGETKIDCKSESYIKAKQNGVEFFAFNTSGCDDSYGNQKIPVKMIKKEFENDTLTVEIEFSDACCISFLGDIKYEDNILDLRYSTYNEPCECRCYYTLEYRIKSRKKYKKILFNGIEIKE